MGERGNIAVEQDGTTIYFYTHWRGHAVQHILASALEKGMARWDDPPYLARIIFGELTKVAQDETTGFGISPNICDNSYEIPVVRTGSRCVEYCGGTYSYQLFVQKYKKVE